MRLLIAAREDAAPLAPDTAGGTGEIRTAVRANFHAPVLGFAARPTRVDSVDRCPMSGQQGQRAQPCFPCYRVWAGLVGGYADVG